MTDQEYTQHELDQMRDKLIDQFAESTGFTLKHTYDHIDHDDPTLDCWFRTENGSEIVLTVAVIDAGDDE